MTTLAQHMATTTSPMTTFKSESTLDNTVTLPLRAFLLLIRALKMVMELFEGLVLRAMMLLLPWPAEKAYLPSVRLSSVLHTV